MMQNVPVISDKVAKTHTSVIFFDFLSSDLNSAYAKTQKPTLFRILKHIFKSIQVLEFANFKSVFDHDGHKLEKNGYRLF